MRLTISILAVLAVVATVSGQINPDRRARFLELRTRARNGDADAQRILQASRRKRPASAGKKEDITPVEVEVQSPTPAPVRASSPVRAPARPARPSFPRAQRVEVEEAAAPVRRRPSIRTRTRNPASRTPTSPIRSQRTRVPIRQRVTRPTAAPTTFRPLTPFPEPTTTQAPTTFVQEVITEAPVFPTAIFTEEPVFETFAPTEAPRTTQARFQPAPTQARFQPAPTQARFQPAPTQAPRRVVEEPVQEPITRTRTNSRGEERVVVDFKPHTALQNGLEVGSRSETFLGNVRHGESTEAPIITNNRYSYFDEEGSYVFGYEATDGSFKEERRALNCIVYGKYGYVDPDGVRREFNYQSGNECDPNAVSDPNLVDGPAPVANDQFNHQTVEKQLSDVELEEVHFNRRRRPQQPRQPVSESTRRVQPVQKTTRPAVRPIVTRPAPRAEVFAQQFADEAPVTQAPSTNNRFTTPASLNPNKHRFNQNVPADNFIESRKPKVIESQAPRQQQVFKPVPVRPSPQPQFTQAPVTLRPVRPTPKPVSFDFDTEFQNLFNHFGPGASVASGVTPRPAPRIPSPVQTTRVTQPQTFKPQTPTFRPTARPTTRPPPPPPTTRQPISRPPPPPQQTTQTEGAHQLVFDPSTGGFKTVRTNVQVQSQPPAQPQSFQPITSKPFVQFTAAPAPRPASPFTSAPVSRPASPITFDERVASPPRAPAPVGVPLASTSRFSPLPSVPTSGLIIHNRGSSVSTDEFDKFFSQFNLKF